MNTSVRARQDARGFSFIELLVTIIIAGIAFAAMVPLFVLAQGKNVDDNMRTISLNLARDKLERVRQLSYDSITEPNLNSPTFPGTLPADGQFGTTWDAKSGTGSSKPMTIAYTVTTFPVPGVTDGSENYKQVQVKVSWTAPPSPVYPAVLSTIIYKQYAEPQIVDFQVGLTPPVLEERGTGVFWITGAPTSLDVYLAPNDIPLMTPPGYVRFSVTSINGLAIAGTDVTASVVGEPGHYQWSWDNVNAPDGTYVLSAVAYSSGSQQGNTVSVAYMVAVKVPPAPTNLQGWVGNTMVALVWDKSPIGDFGHYVLERSVGNSGTWAQIGGPLGVANYTDTAVTNGFQYYYRVSVVDTEVPPNASPYSVPTVALEPAVQADTVPPNKPNSLTATAVSGAQSIKLTWPIPTDGGTPATGVKGYNVERSPDNGSTWTQILSFISFNQPTYLDTNVGWLTTRSYRVQAVDVAGNRSAWSPVASATTGAQPPHNLTVYNAKGSETLYVRVQSVAGLYWNTNGTLATGVPTEVQIKQNKDETWSNLPEGNYNVFGRYGSSTTSKNTTWSSDPWSVSFP
jgi:prepilin-type N-terminal cleavage/methylation domain-containing protein